MAISASSVNSGIHGLGLGHPLGDRALRRALLDDVRRAAAVAVRVRFRLPAAGGGPFFLSFITIFKKSNLVMISIIKHL